MTDQSIRFAAIDGRRVAWSAVGSGPPLVIGGWWMSHLELEWRNPAFQAFAEPLARHRTVIRYDRPGTGLSDDDGPPPADLDSEVAVLAGVIEHLDAERVDLLGASTGGPVAAAYAAASPDRIERLVLYGSYADGAGLADYAARESVLAMVQGHWGFGSRVLADLFMPSATAAEREAFSAFQRESASAGVAARSLESAYSFDVQDCLSEIRTPTLVLHRREDRGVPIAFGQDLAARIPGATFRALDGADHAPWHGDTVELLRAILAGLDADDSELEAAAGGSASGEGIPDRTVSETDLSERELEILQLIALGLTNGEIAERLVLSPHTVHRHVANVRTKLRLPSRAAAAAHAARLGLI